MGCFHVSARIENAAERTRSVGVSRLLVDTGSEYSWVSAKSLERIGVAREKKDVQFVLANGVRISRGIGFAVIRVGTAFTVDEVVFAQRGDSRILGARTLEGMGLVVDVRKKILIPADPLSVASSSTE